MHADGDPVVPVLVHLRDLEKAHDLNQLVAAQLTAGGERRIDLTMFRYLLREGRIATVSTDHAPWPIETKQRPILRASAGMPGLETFLAGMVTAGVKRDFPLPELLGYLTWRPAEVFGLAGRKGRLAVGLDADVAVFDARSPWAFHAAETPSAADWSPFDGWSFAGRVEATYVRGRRVFEDGRVVGPAGGGQFLQRSA